MVSQSSSKKSLSTQSSRSSKNSRSKTFNRRTFSISLFRLMAIRKFRKLGSLRKTSRVLGINRKTFICWIRQEVNVKLQVS